MDQTQANGPKINSAVKNRSVKTPFVVSMAYLLRGENAKSTVDNGISQSDAPRRIKAKTPAAMPSRYRVTIARRKVSFFIGN